METSSVLAAVRLQIRSALAPLASDVAALGASSEAARIALEQVGAALRTGVELPATLRAWLGTLPLPTSGKVVAQLRDEIAGWALPGHVIDADDQLGFVITRRDAVESAVKALLRHSIAAGLPTSAIPGWSELATELDTFDSRLAKVATRQAAEALLGEQAALLGDAPWTARLPEPEESGAGAEPTAWTNAMLAAPPSDDAVTRYATEGAWAAYVEGFAARSETFAADLEQVLQTLIELRATDALQPRRWLKLRRRESAIRLQPYAPTALAAATGEIEAPRPPAPLRLGVLTPIDAEVLLHSTATEVFLTVVPRDPASLVEVALGLAVTTTPDEEGVWVARLPRTEDPVRMRIIARHGAPIEETLHLSAAPAE